MKLTYREALRESLRRALESSDKTILLGEDVGMYGGTYSISKGLLEKFGESRVRDTPLSEGGFTGVALGLALAGLRPIVEIMTINFSLLAFDQLINSAAVMKSMSGNQFSVPIILRMSSGGGKQLGAQHSNSFESWLSHIPGLKILSLSTVDDARSMLSFALTIPDPVLLIEYPDLFEIEEESSFIQDEDFHKPKILQSGGDLTLITYGASLQKAKKVLANLKNEKISIELINLRSLRPLDDRVLIESSNKTKKVLLVDESWGSGGVMSDISTRILQKTDAMVGRLSKRDVPHPYTRSLENALIPQEEDIEKMIREILYAS